MKSLIPTLFLIILLDVLLFPLNFAWADAESENTREQRWEEWKEQRKERLEAVERLSGDKNKEETDDESSSLTQEDYEFALTVNNQKRTYDLHLPKNYDLQKPTPVVLNFHGGGGSALGHAKLSRFNEASDKFGFIAVYPVGTRPDGKLNNKYQRYWNPGDGPTGQINTALKVLKADDLKFTNMILDDLERRFNVDKTRIFATGLSNGATLVHRLGCDLSDRIAAIAPIAAPMWHDPQSCHPQNPISVIYFHGTADVCAPYDGGPSQCEKGYANKGRVFPAATDTFNTWKEKNNCIGEPVVTYQKGEVTCETYKECREGAEVTFCSIEGGGHTWPGGTPYTIPGLDIGKVTQDIDANQAMWDFFQRHPRR